MKKILKKKSRDFQHYVYIYKYIIIIFREQMKDYKKLLIK